MTTEMTPAMRSRLEAMGIRQPNAMQQSMLAAAGSAADLLLLSPPGSGKTLAFLLPVLHELEKSGSASP